MEQIVNSWSNPVNCVNSAHVVSAKFKLLRRVMKLRAKNLSKLSKLISNCNLTVAFMDNLEEIRALHPHESIFREVIKLHLQNLLHMQTTY